MSETGTHEERTQSDPVRQVKELAAQLADARRELESLSYAVSHDLRAPLRTIFGFTQLLVRKYRGCLEGQGVDYLDRIGAGVSRMERMIDDMLKLSRVGRAEMTRERVDLSALAEDVVEELRRVDPGRAVDVVIEPGAVVSGDRALLRLALLQLLDNAWKFTAATEAPLIRFTVHDLNGQLRCCVDDNGAGFTMDQADRLFKPFQRLHLDTEFPGTGMGLAVFRKIVERHGGTVRAEGAEGRGATFCFILGMKT